MKVLMLGWDFPPRASGGLGTACRGITHGLTQAGTEVLLVLPKKPQQGVLAGLDAMGCERVPIIEELRWSRSRVREVLGVPVSLDPYSGRSFRVQERGHDFYAELERYTRAVGEIARVRDFDVIHAHDWMSFAAGLYAKELTGKPLITHVHSLEVDRAGADEDPRVVALERMGLELSDQVVCVSRSTATSLENRYGIARSKIRVVHNGVVSLPATNEQKEASAEKLVLFLGRITRQKDPETFLKAAAIVHDQVPSAKFVLAGDGDLLPDMVQLSRQLGLGRAVRFTGFLDAEHVDRMYERADVFVMPSRSEPFGLVSLEAMAHGVPVVATRGSGVLEALPSALSADAGDARGLARHIVALLTKPALRKAVLAAGATEVKRASWDRCGEELSQVYRELAG